MSRTRPNESGDDVIGQLAPMRRYAHTLTRDETLAEDLVHDALVRAYERRATFRSGANLRTWLLAILHNTFVDRWRQREAEPSRLVETIAPADQESRVRFQQIAQAFQALPDEQRAVLHLVAIEGLPYNEAAR